jgi:Spy/CpxP family protein refolding chaperone
MLRVASTVLALVVSLVLADSLLAQQPARGQGRGQGRRGQSATAMIDRLERIPGINLTDEQKTKLSELKKAYAPKAKTLADKLTAVPTDEQKKARDAAMKEARDAGKRGSEVRDAVQAAMKLTDAQKAEMAKLRKAQGDLNKEVTDKVNKILTAEQQETLKKARESRGNRGGRGNRQRSST